MHPLMCPWPLSSAALPLAPLLPDQAAFPGSLPPSAAPNNPGALPAAALLLSAALPPPPPATEKPQLSSALHMHHTNSNPVYVLPSNASNIACAILQAADVLTAALWEMRLDARPSTARRGSQWLFPILVPLRMKCNLHKYAKVIL